MILGQDEKAEELLSRASALKLKHLLLTYTSLSEQAKIAYLNKEALQFSYLPSVLLLQKEKKPSLIEQVFRNILSNAIHYSLPNSSIEIGSETTDASTAISISNISDKTDAISFDHDSLLTSNKSGLGITLIKEFTGKLDGSIQYTKVQNRVLAKVAFPNSVHRS